MTGAERQCLDETNPEDPLTGSNANVAVVMAAGAPTSQIDGLKDL